MTILPVVFHEICIFGLLREELGSLFIILGFIRDNDNIYQLLMVQLIRADFVDKAEYNDAQIAEFQFIRYFQYTNFIRF